MFSEKSKIIIAGVHKAGTTSLYDYLLSHPDVGGGEVKEIHYYTPLRYRKSLAAGSQYSDCFKNTKENVLLDASPSYLYGGERIASRLFEDNPDAYVVVILRDPVDRLVSFYSYLQSEFRLSKEISFRDFFRSSYELRSSRDVDDVTSRAYREGSYINYLRPWRRIFGDRFKIVFLDDLKNKPIETMTELAVWSGLSRGAFEGEGLYSVSNKTVGSKSEVMYSLASRINSKFEKFFRENQRIKRALKRVYFLLNGKAVDSKVRECDVEELRGLYKRDNDSLSLFLSEMKCEQPNWLK